MGHDDPPLRAGIGFMAYRRKSKLSLIRTRLAASKGAQSSFHIGACVAGAADRVEQDAGAGLTPIALDFHPG
jgi:hypothetical protein